MKTTDTYDLKEIFELLEQQGWNPRLCDTPVPYYDTAVPCGSPQEVGELPPETKMVPLEFLAATPMFMVDVKGDSMKDAGITEGDTVTVVTGTRFEDGDIVLVMMDGEMTVKSFFRDEDGEPWLVPQNAEYEAFPLSSRQDAWLIGVVRDVTKHAPRISYRSCRNSVAKAKAKLEKREGIPPERVSAAIREIAPMVTSRRQWYAVYRAMVDARVMKEKDFDAFIERVTAEVPHHPALPTRHEMQRMAIQSFAKPVVLWTEDNAPIKGKRFDVYLHIAQRTAELLNPE